MTQTRENARETARQSMQKSIQKNESTIETQEITLPETTEEPQTTQVWQSLNLTDQQIKRLSAPCNRDEILIRPDGIVYAPHIRYRQTLIAVFGAGNWRLQQLKLFREGLLVCFYGQLIVRGQIIDTAIGAAEYKPDNRRMNYDDVIESAKSQCLVRNCKTLGIYMELWDSSFIRQWTEEYAVAVICEHDKDGSQREFFRRLIDPPLNEWPWKEIRVAEQERITREDQGALWVLAQGFGHTAESFRDVLRGHGYENRVDILKRDYNKILLSLPQNGTTKKGGRR